MLAFVAREAEQGEAQLFVRRLDQTRASVLSGTEGARSPFFSPDGQWIGFFASGKLKKIAVVGGAAVTLADAGNDRGGSWSEDGTIVFAPGNRQPLFRVSSAGGTLEPLTTLDEEESEVSHRWPQALPGGKAVLFTASAAGSNYEEAHFVVQSLASGARKIVHRGGFHARYLNSGHLVYVHEGTLFVAPFDLDRLEMTGAPAPALENVSAYRFRGAAQYALSDNGTLVYVPGGTVGGRSIDWMDRAGKREPLRSARGLYSHPQFSPDGRRLAVTILDRYLDVWVYDWERDTMSRLTFAPENDESPRWTPDGLRIAFGSWRDSTKSSNLYWKRADGTGDVERLTESEFPQRPGSWHPNGKFLAFTETKAGGGDVLILPIEGDESSGLKPGQPTAFLDEPFSEVHPSFSPDGRFLAYASYESGRFDVFVQSFPGPGGKWLISTDGGTWPTWSQNGEELFYRTADASRIMVATYAVEGETFRAEKPRLWSEGRFTPTPGFRNFDLHPDGDRFAVLVADDASVASKRDKVTFIFNFFEELERVAPSK
jgi:serine/threonine-protein kinase